MTSTERTFNSSGKECGKGTPCAPRVSEKRSDLFSYDWDVFVIRHDPTRGRFDWYTLCCEDRRPIG